MAKPLEISFRLGRSRGRVDATTNEGVENLVSLIDELVRYKASDIAKRNFDARRLQNDLDQLIKQDLNQAAAFAVSKMIGIVPNQYRDNHVIYFDAAQSGKFNTESNRQHETFKGQIFTHEGYGSGRIQWTQLKANTVDKKYRRTLSHIDAHRFFKDRGTLAQNMVEKLNGIAYRTGTVTLRIRDTSMSAGSRAVRVRGKEAHPLKDITIRILPRLRQSMLQTLQKFWLTSHEERGIQLAQFLGLSEEDAIKLANPRGEHRPLLEPVLSFWIMNRIPFSIRTALNRSIKNV